MLEQLMALYDHLLGNFKDYPMAQNAIVATSSLAISGAIGFALVKTPRRITQFFRNQFLTSLVFNTGGSNWSCYNSEQYAAFLKWFAKNSWFNWSRVITLDGEADPTKGGAVGPGVGRHFFFYKRHLFIFSIQEIDASATQMSKYRLSISKFGRSHKLIFDLMDAFMEKGDDHTSIRSFVNTVSDWNYLCRLPKRNLDTVIVTKNVQTELIDNIFEFARNRDWYMSRGLSYKMTVLMYGKPGTGKSSLISALAAALGRDIHILKPAGGLSYQALFQRARGGIVIIEDIDTYSFSASRDASMSNVLKLEQEKRQLQKPIEIEESPINSGMAETLTVSGSGDGKSFDEYLNGSLSDFLNGLDGVLRLEDVIVFMTTNHPEKLDAALLRDGRVDLRVEIEELGDTEIRRFFGMAFPDAPAPSPIPFHPLPGATVQALFMLNKFNPEQYERALRGVMLEEVA